MRRWTQDLRVALKCFDAQEPRALGSDPDDLAGGLPNQPVDGLLAILTVLAVLKECAAARDDQAEQNHTLMLT